MRLTPFLASGLILVGLPAVFRQIQQRRRREQHNRQVYLSLYFEQPSIAATRAGRPLYDFLHDCRHHGATHIALLEDTLDSLIRAGALTPHGSGLPDVHRFTSPRSGLITRLQAEFQARFPHLLAETSPDSLDLTGDLAAIRPLGLGFDPETFRFARATGLQLIARPVSYPWPTAATIERTLAQAAGLEASIIAFADDPLLGHEMHLADTAASLRRHNLTAAYFPDSRHQRGDWFIAKTAPDCTLPALRYTPADLDREDGTFHDDGATDMARMLKVYSECGFDGPMRPDHAPTLANETNDRPGYAINAKLFALGYMKGIMEGAGLPYA